MRLEGNYSLSVRPVRATQPKHHPSALRPDNCSRAAGSGRQNPSVGRGGTVRPPALVGSYSYDEQWRLPERRPIVSVADTFNTFQGVVNAEVEAVREARSRRDLFKGAFGTEDDVLEVLPSGSLARGTQKGLLHE